MKILLIQSHLGRICDQKFPLFPIGLSYIAQALKKHEVRILDLNFWDLPRAYKKLEEELINFDPDIAGLSIRNIDTAQRTDIFYYFNTVQPTARLIKKVSPEIRLLVGGPGYSVFAREIMERIPEFDFGIYLEGDESTPELIDNIDSPDSVKGIYIKGKNSVVFTGKRAFPDFSKLSAPARESHIIDIKKYIGATGYNIGIQTKRGCVLECSYCGYPFLTGKKLRIRTPESVVDEIESLISFGIKTFFFVDNIFNVPKSHAMEICKEITRRNLDVKWTAWYEIKNMDEELLLAAKKAGCIHFGFSPDAANDKALAILKKGITRNDIDECILLVRKHKVRAGFNLFILPEMSPREIIQSFILNFKIPLILRFKGGGSIGWIRIEPHTAIHKMVIQNGYLKKDTNLFPEKEKKLSELFYYDHSHPLIDRLLIFVAYTLRERIKPIVKKIFIRAQS